MGNESNHWPEVLTEQELAEYLRIPADPKHVAYLRTRRKLPSINFNIDKQPQHVYPLSAVRAWIDKQATMRQSRAKRGD